MRRPFICQGAIRSRVLRHTLLCSEIAVLSPNVLEFARGWIENLDVAREVLVAINLGKVAKSLIRNLGHIKLVVSDSQQVVVHVLKNGIRDVAVGRCGIAEPSAIVQILFPGQQGHCFLLTRSALLVPRALMADTNPRIDEKQIDAKFASFLFHVLCKAHEVAPVGTIVLFLDVPFQPSMGVSCVQEVDLTPF